MKLMDCVELTVERNEYAKEGVHKGMQGVIWEAESKDGAWVVLFPQYGEKEDIADLYINEKELRLLPNGMDARINEQIKIQFDVPKETDKSFSDRSGLSDYVI